MANEEEKCFWDLVPGFFDDGDAAFITSCLQAFDFTGTPKSGGTCPKCQNEIVITEVKDD